MKESATRFDGVHGAQQARESKMAEQTPLSLMMAAKVLRREGW